MFTLAYGCVGERVDAQRKLGSPTRQQRVASSLSALSCARCAR
jgi:hypothetical protein